MFYPGLADRPIGMLSVVFLVALLTLAPCPGQAQTVGITGTVRVTTTLTKKRISVPQVYERAVAIAPPPVGVRDVEAELRRVVVYVDGAKLAARPLRVTMNQAQRRFDPEVVAVSAGSTVSFPNGDPIFHNVFSLSETKRFDLGNYKEGDTRLVTFAHPGVVQVHCHLHANMSGAILVTPNSWFTQPAPSGAFSLPALPPGHYTVVAWHKTAGFFRREIDVREGQPLNLDFEIPILEGAGH